MYYYLYAKFGNRIALVSKHLMALEALNVAESQIKHHNYHKLRFFIAKEEFYSPISYSQLGTAVAEEKRKVDALKNSRGSPEG